jgi:hypothetical protein
LLSATLAMLLVDTNTLPISIGERLA